MGLRIWDCGFHGWYGTQSQNARSAVLRGDRTFAIGAIILAIVRSNSTWFALLVSAAFLVSVPLASAQSFSFPKESALARGTGDCQDLFIGIANAYSRVRKGREFTVTAAHPLSIEEKLAYSWEVSNGRIISGQGTGQLTLKAGGEKTRGYSNIDGHVSISLKVTRPGGCSVTTTERVMVGRHQEYNGPANVDDVTLDEEQLMWCEPGRRPLGDSVAAKDMIVRVTTKASDPENDVPTYAYVVSGGNILGAGRTVDWDLTGVEPGTYTLTAMAQDGYGVRGRVVKKEVIVEACTACGFIDCPTITILGPRTIDSESLFTAHVSGGSQESVTYEWSVTGGEVIGGQGTPAVTVKIHTVVGGSVTVKIGGLDPRGDCMDSVTKEFQ